MVLMKIGREWNEREGVMDNVGEYGVKGDLGEKLPGELGRFAHVELLLENRSTTHHRCRVLRGTLTLMKLVGFRDRSLGWSGEQSQSSSDWSKVRRGNPSIPFLANAIIHAAIRK